MVGREDGCSASKPGDALLGGCCAGEDVGEDCLAELERELEEVAFRSGWVTVLTFFVLEIESRFGFVRQFIGCFWGDEGIVCGRVVWVREVEETLVITIDGD